MALIEERYRFFRVSCSLYIIFSRRDHFAPYRTAVGSLNSPFDGGLFTACNKPIRHGMHQPRHALRGNNRMIQERRVNGIEGRTCEIKRRSLHFPSEKAYCWNEKINCFSATINGER